MHDVSQPDEDGVAEGGEKRVITVSSCVRVGWEKRNEKKKKSPECGNPVLPRGMAGVRCACVCVSL